MSRPDPERWRRLVTKMGGGGKWNKCLKHNQVMKVIFIQVAHLPSAREGNLVKKKKKKNVLVEVIFMHTIFLPARGISESNSAAIKLN